MSDNDLYQNSLSRLERLLANPNGFSSEDLMNKLSWVEKRLKDKRKRPAAAKQAIAWLKARGNLWDTYLAEYAPPDTINARRYRTYNKKRQGRTITVRVVRPEQEEWLKAQMLPNEGESSALKRLAGMPPDKPD